MADTVIRINAAIDECLKRLEGKADPCAELQAYLAEQQGKMRVEELRTIESRVFGILQDRERQRRR